MATLNFSDWALYADQQPATESNNRHLRKLQPATTDSGILPRPQLVSQSNKSVPAVRRQKTEDAVDVDVTANPTSRQSALRFSSIDVFSAAFKMDLQEFEPAEKRLRVLRLIQRAFRSFFVTSPRSPR